MSMLVNDYQKEALRTANPLISRRAMLEEGVMGMCGESGECLDLIKKYRFQNHELDVEHLAKELGDVAWYLSEAAYALGYDLESIFRLNLEKLSERYPDGFRTENSVNRKPGDI